MTFEEVMADINRKATEMTANDLMAGGWSPEMSWFLARLAAELADKRPAETQEVKQP